MFFFKRLNPKAEEIEVAGEIVTLAPNCGEFGNIGSPDDNDIGIAIQSQSKTALLSISSLPSMQTMQWLQTST